MDKAFKRELGPLPYYSDLLLLYQDRSRGYTYQADFRMAELDDMMTAPTSLVPQQEQQRMQAPVLGYLSPTSPPFPSPFSSLLVHSHSQATMTTLPHNLLVLLWVLKAVYAGGSCTDPNSKAKLKDLT